MERKTKNIIDLVSGFVEDKSRRNIKRLIAQNAVRIDGRIITDFDEEIDITRQFVLQIGKSSNTLKLATPDGKEIQLIIEKL